MVTMKKKKPKTKNNKTSSIFGVFRNRNDPVSIVKEQKKSRSHSQVFPFLSADSFLKKKNWLLVFHC